MKKLKLGLVLVILTTWAAVGCGGLDDGALLAELSTEELQTLCEGKTAEEADCGEGVMISTDDAAACEASVSAIPEGCEATVADFEACEEVAPCERLSAEACKPLLSCSGG